MEWYWWALVVVVVLVVLRRVVSKRPSDGGADDLRAILASRPPPGASPKPRPSINAVLKPYLTALCRVYATNNRSFASTETGQIGREIHERHGHAGMVSVCDEIGQVLGSAAARDLEYKWSGIGEWQG